MMYLDAATLKCSESAAAAIAAQSVVAGAAPSGCDNEANCVRFRLQNASQAPQ
jgi:hypothetical protein